MPRGKIWPYPGVISSYSLGIRKTESSLKLQESVRLCFICCKYIKEKEGHGQEMAQSETK